jgi:hypothetical protein
MKAQRTGDNEDWATFRRLRNEYKDMTTEAREKYDQKTIGDLANKSLLNPKRWWDLTKKVLGISASSIPALFYNG